MTHFGLSPDSILSYFKNIDTVVCKNIKMYKYIKKNYEKRLLLKIELKMWINYIFLTVVGK